MRSVMLWSSRRIAAITACSALPALPLDWKAATPRMRCPRERQPPSTAVSSPVRPYSRLRMPCCSNQRSRRQDLSNSPDPSHIPSTTLGSQNYRLGRKAGREILPRRAFDPFHVHRSHRWHFPGSDRYSNLWRTRWLG